MFLARTERERCWCILIFDNNCCGSAGKKTAARRADIGSLIIFFLPLFHLALPGHSLSLCDNISSTSGLKELALVKRRNILVLHLSSCSKLVPTEIQARSQRSQLARLRSSLDPLKPVCSAKCFQFARTHTHVRRRVTHVHTCMYTKG